MKTHLTLFLSLLLWSAWAQQHVSLSGRVTDGRTGEDLIGAAVYSPLQKSGTTTNAYGFYSLTLPAGKQKLEVSYIGYQSEMIELDLTANQTLDLTLNEGSTELTEVVISDQSSRAHVEDLKMSSKVLSVEALKDIPAFMGEVDVLKTIQSLPGIQSGGEGTTGFFVRGGTADQNLIQLDEATVYNASHLMGFFSVFNADALKDAEIYKGGIPAQYGGRVSSLLDIRLREGNNQKFSGSGGLGLIASRLTLEGPIQKDKSSFILSGRRTYADLFLALSPEENLKSSKLYFYDLNAKMNFRLDERDRIFVSGYFGDDVLKYKDQLHWAWGNRTATVRWNHLFSSKLFANFSMVHSDFNYNIGTDAGPSSMDWKASIRDETFKADFSYFPHMRYSFKMGLVSTYRNIRPGTVEVKSEDINTTIDLDHKKALESAAYFSSKFDITERLTAEAGLRYSMFYNIGGTEYQFEDGTPEPIGVVKSYDTELHSPQFGLGPRLNMRYLLSDENSVKLSYTRMFQYLHLASNTTSGTPLDVYFQSSKDIKPQIADQIALGYFHNFADNRYEFSTEVYYKYMQNQIDFRDNADLLLNNHLEREVLAGSGEAYGLELLLKKSEGRLKGWVSYTISRSEKTIAGINNGNPYRPRQDRPHSVNLVGSYQLRPRLQLGASWTYASGMPVTIPTSSYENDGIVVPVYEERNGYRLPASHRLDLSLTLDNKKKPGRNWDSSWNFSLYNVYARQNAFSIQTRQNEENPKLTEAVQISLIGTVIPSITYNFNF